MTTTSASPSSPTGPPSTAWSVLLGTLRRQRRALLGAGLLLTLWQVCEAAVPVLIGVVIDRAVAEGDTGELVLWGAVLCVHFAVLSTAYRLGARIGFRAEQVESHRLRTAVSGHVLDPRGARTGQLPGDLLSVATSDAEMVGVVIRQLALTAAAVVGFVLTGVVLASIDPFLAVLVLVGVPAVLGITQLLSRPLVVRSEVRQEALGQAVGLATDLVRGLRPLKGVRGEDAALARYRTLSRHAAGASVAAARWEGLLYGVTQGLSGLFLAAVALVAGTRAVQGDLGIGELIAVVGLAQFVAEPIRMVSYLVAELAQSRASAGRIASVLSSPRLVVSGEKRGQDDVPADLVLERVSSAGLECLSFSAAPGELVALVVEQPVDAAALMSLLHGETEPTHGAVLLGGVPITDLDLGDARAALLVVDHHIDLFEGDLRSNVDAAGGLDADTLTGVLAASAADDVVDHAPLGLDDPVTVGGTTLSGGQRQRLGLARALAAGAPALVLNDPTTAVDAVTEARIAAGLREVRGGDRLTVVITGSPALLAVADRVVHVRDGRAVATGTHRDLLDDAAYRAAVLR